MKKNLFLTCLLLVASYAYAKEPIERESLLEAENFKVEKAVKEKEVKRSFAGSRAKKEVPEELQKDEIKTEDSEVRYWQYSE